MRRLDFLLFAAWAALLLSFLAPALFNSAFAVSSFGDLYSYHYPMRQLVVGALQAGRLPFWNPYIFCGVPLSANSQAVVFYPASVLGAFFPLTLALTWDYAFHWVWGGLGLYLLAKRGGIDAPGALFLSSIFSLSPFLVYRMAEGIPTLLASLAWVPWCWLALLSRRSGLLAAVWALQFLSGHPQFMLVNAAGMGLWALAQKKRLELLRFSLGEGLAAAALAAVQWVPTWEFLGHSVRTIWNNAATTAYTLSARMLATWIYPGALGDPLARTWGDVPSEFFECCSVFIGVSGLLAAAAGFYSLWRKGARRSWGAALGLLVLGVFFAAGGRTPAYRALMTVGVLNFLRTPARYALLSLWGLVLAAGAGLLWSQTRLKPAWRWAALAAALIELLAWDGRFLTGERASRYLGINHFVVDQAAGRPLRVMTDPDFASSNKSMLYRAMNVNGYEAFYLAGFPSYAARSEGHPIADASRSYLRRYDSPEMDRASVGYFISKDGSLRANPGRLPLAYFVDEDNRPVKGHPLRVALDRPERWTISGSFPEKGNVKLVLAEPFYPGWRAWLGGERAAPRLWDGFFQAIEIPDGWAGKPLSLRLSFEPTGWPLWAGISILSWLGWFERRRRLLAAAA